MSRGELHGTAPGTEIFRGHPVSPKAVPAPVFRAGQAGPGLEKDSHRTLLLVQGSGEQTLRPGSENTQFIPGVLGKMPGVGEEDREEQPASMVTSRNQWPLRATGVHSTGHL